MHIQIRIHHWVLWWFYVGVVCGVVALVNILSRNLSPTQVDVILALGALHWLLGGLVCYGLDAVKIAMPSKSPVKAKAPQPSDQREWHYASEFVLSGNRKSLLPPRY